MSIQISPTIQFTAIETVEADAADQMSVSQNGFNLNNVSLNANSTVPATKSSYKTYTLGGGGTLTIDLTDLDGLLEAAVDGTGLKVQTIVVRNPSSNNAVTIAPGASNPYPLWGTGNSREVKPGARFGEYFADQLADVASNAKEIDLSGTAGQTIDIGLCLG